MAPTLPTKTIGPQVPFKDSIRMMRNSADIQHEILMKDGIFWKNGSGNTYLKGNRLGIVTLGSCKDDREHYLGVESTFRTGEG